MDSSDMGSIALEASTDEGANWTSIWSETGNKGNSWQNASIDLAAYVGGGVQLRFNRITGGTWQADIAIDNVTLNNSTGGGPVDQCDGVSEWSSTQTYQAGDLVTYQGNLYQRTATGWTNLGPCGTTTSFADLSDVSGPPVAGQISVYPNPVRDGQLNVATLTSGTKQYVIYNTLGQTVANGTLTNSIDVNRLEAGIYMLKVDNYKTQRFIVE